jgi:CMP-N,N'-diacetyllegionaminic acid synthase
MIRGKRLVAIIPVRGGSQGIPRKNLYQLAGRSLLERTIDLALANKRVDQVLVSTDDSEMHSIAKKHGVASANLRPAHLATPEARTVDVVLHHLDELSLEDAYVLLLQVTTPLRNRLDLEGFLTSFEAKPEAEAAVSLVRHGSPHPLKLQVIDAQNDFVRSYAGVESMVPRQELPPVYALNGAFYLTSAAILRKQRTFLPIRTHPFVMAPERSVNLDSHLDLMLMEALVAQGKVKLDPPGSP